MGKTLVYLILLVVLGVGVYFFVFKDNNSLYREKEANFTFRDTANVGKIFLVNNDGHSILLERNQGVGGWTLNKKFPAMPIQIVNILTCLRLQSSLIPVSDIEHDRVVKLLAGLATKVEVYNLAGKKLASFYVGGQGPNYRGSYMIHEGAQQAYLVEIPGFDGYLTPRYSVDVNDWRSRSMINWPMDSIASVRVDYAKETDHSFSVTNSSGTPVVSAAPVIQNKGALNVRRVLSYLSFFKDINAEGYLNGTLGLDTMIKPSRLRCQLKVENRAGSIKSYDLYWIPPKLMLESDLEGIPKDVERLYAVDLVNKDTLLVQTRTFDKLLRIAPDFYTDGD